VNTRRKDNFLTKHENYHVGWELTAILFLSKRGLSLKNIYPENCEVSFSKNKLKEGDPPVVKN